MIHQKTKTSTRRKQVAARRKQEQIRNILLIAGGILVFAALLGLSLHGSAAQNVVPPHPGAALGDFTLSDLQGNPVKLSDYKGKTVLVNTWATWCPPCRAEMPDLERYYEAHKEQGFAILALNAGDPADSAQQFAQSNGLTFPVLLDPGTQVINAMGIHSFPTSVIVGADNQVKAIHVGMFTPQSLEAEVTPYITQ